MGNGSVVCGSVYKWVWEFGVFWLLVFFGKTILLQTFLKVGDADTGTETLWACNIYIKVSKNKSIKFETEQTFHTQVGEPAAQQVFVPSMVLPYEHQNM